MPRKASRCKRFYLASLDEVAITRDGDTATITYVEDNVMIHCLKLGPAIEHMTDQDILDEHNAHIRTTGELAHEYRDMLLTEVSLGKPQVEYFDRGRYWVPRADVLRCIVTADTEADKTAIIIDDLEFSLQEFGKMLSTREGWGKRIAFVTEPRQSCRCSDSTFRLQCSQLSIPQAWTAAPRCLIWDSSCRLRGRSTPSYPSEKQLYFVETKD